MTGHNLNLEKQIKKREKSNTSLFSFTKKTISDIIIIRERGGSKMKISDINLNNNMELDMKLFTPEEFEMITGTNLNVVLNNELGDNTNKINRFISDVGYMIKQLVLDYSFKELTMNVEGEMFYNGIRIDNKYVLECIKRAGIEQGSYMLINGDLASRAGIGIDRVLFSVKSKRKAMYSDRAKSYLYDAGLLRGQL